MRGDYAYCRKHAGAIAVVLAVYLAMIIWRVAFVNDLHGNMVDLTVVAQFLINGSILLTLVALVSRTADARDLVLAVALGTVLEEAGVFSTMIPALLIAGYEAATGEYGSNVTAIEVAPKYTAYLVLAVLLTAKLRHREERSLDRVIVAVVSWAMIVTTFIFHVLVVNGSLYDLKARRFNMLETVVQVEDEGQFRHLCEEFRLACGIRAPGDEQPLFDSELSYANETVEYILRQGGADTLPTAYEPVYDLAEMAPWEGDDRIFEENEEREIGYLGVVRGDESGVRAALDLEWQQIMDRQQMTIIVLILAAHITWVGGGVFLSHLHRSRALRSISLRRPGAASR